MKRIRECCSQSGAFAGEPAFGVAAGRGGGAWHKGLTCALAAGLGLGLAAFGARARPGPGDGRGDGVDRPESQLGRSDLPAAHRGSRAHGGARSYAFVIAIFLQGKV